MFRRSIWALAGLTVLILSSQALAGQARVLEATDSEMFIEFATDDFSIEEVVHGGESFSRVTVPGYAWTTEPGLPRLPMDGVLVGVPFGAAVSLDVVRADVEGLGRVLVEPAPLERVSGDADFPVAYQEFTPDDEFYAGAGAHPQRVASLGFDSRLRHQRVVQVLFYPFQFSARTGELSVRRRIVVRLRISAPRRVEGLRPVRVDEPEWEGVYGTTIVNYEQAKKWRMRPEPLRAHLRADLRRDDESYKLIVGDTGMYRLAFSELASEGLAGTLPVDDVGVYQRSFDDSEEDPFVDTPIPIVVVDADEDGAFDGSDYLLFYAQSFEDQFVLEGYEDRYTVDNVYWFGWGDGIAARMDSRTGWHGASGLAPPVSFRDTLRFEEDTYFYAIPASDELDIYHWTSTTSNGDVYELPFSVYDIDPAGDIVLRARYQGTENTNHVIDLSIVNGASQENAVGRFQFSGVSVNMDNHIFVSSAIPASYFTQGENDLRLVGSGGTAGRSGANLDWFDLAYQRRYVAQGGRLAFTNAGETGMSEFEITDFPGDDIMLFDVSDPLAPVVFDLGEENVEPDGAGGYRLVFQDSVQGGFERYEACDGDGHYSVSSIERREPANLYADEADLIVISYEGFSAGVQPLIDRRRSQGFVVAHAEIGQVFDEFGGGYVSPQAIRNYFDYAYSEWTRQPQFALLVGDASEDTRHLLSTSQPNFIPTIMFRIDDEHNMAASDQWYTSTEGPPYLPQMFIGRLSVGGTNQLGIVVSKILAYEQYPATAPWRKNVLFIADDLWSYRTLESPYSLKTWESDFTDVSLDLADLVAASPARLDTTLLLLRRYTDPFHGSTTSGDIGYAIQTVMFVRANVTPVLLDMMSDSAALTTFEGHGNRTQLTHEQLLLASSGSANDIGNINNEGRPFIFMGFSCELSRFHDSREGSSNGIECVMEQMLFRPDDAGAVATFACSGIAFLGPNAIFHDRIFKAFFTEPTPEGPSSDVFWPRWTLGGLLARGTVLYYESQGYPSKPPSYILLGDPTMHIEMSPPSFAVTVDGSPFTSGDLLQSPGHNQPVQIVASIVDELEIDRASVVIEETDIGVVDPSLYTLEAVGDTVTNVNVSREWLLRYETPIRSFLSYDIRISATDLTEQKTTFLIHALGDSVEIPLGLREIANYPNPFGRDTRLIYTIDNETAVRDVTISIYTVGGRLIRLLEGTTDVNYNQVAWDGTDQQGDQVANGVYLYVVEARSWEGETVTSDVGRMLRLR
jgi:hypothetical protein